MRKHRLNGRTLMDPSDKIRDAERVCAVCGAELEIEPESGELHCPVCEETSTP